MNENYTMKLKINIISFIHIDDTVGDIDFVLVQMKRGNIVVQVSEFQRFIIKKSMIAIQIV